MRWEAQTLRAGSGAEQTGTGTPAGTPALLPLPGLQRTVTTPEFAGVTFHEVEAKTVLNRVPEASQMPFRWTVNPYRGCTHACRYCFARSTHEFLDLDAGADFDRQIVVKVNAPEVLRAELARPTWGRETVALGTNTDPYQRAEGRYRLMPGIISALAESGTPFSILTKGTLLARDVPLLAAAARSVPVDVGVSLALLDPSIAEAVEPGTPSPTARLKLIEKLAAAGARVHVMAMPILPWLTDGDEQLDLLMRAVAAAGASSVLTGALHLRPGARQWYLDWIAAEHPQLLDGYRRMYRRSSYAPASYRAGLERRGVAAARRYGLRIGGAQGIQREDGPPIESRPLPVGEGLLAAAAETRTSRAGRPSATGRFAGTAARTHRGRAAVSDAAGAARRAPLTQPALF
ncbi:Radical SAM domain protein [Micrococcus lylae]|uniref:Radical SAM domain protein n=1 Tax=Micrococcus lylae TaxID=1273 RepID=A0A1R4I6F6_9MICC|nr:Rv2578c family radical SAM protein [Micrococcus lylae]SJN15368.1 Radical SAM domain protein [Micrococcus lylae]